MKYSDSSHFILFSTCIPVRGAKRAIIYDIQRNNFEFIPNELYSILTRCSKKTIGEIKDLFNREYDAIIDEYFDFLIEKEFVIPVSKLDKGFTKFNPVYEVPNAVTNCIIDFDERSEHPMKKIKDELDGLICQALQLRFYYPVTLQQLKEHLNHFNDSKLRSIELILPFSDLFSKKDWEELNLKFPRLLLIMIYGAPENKSEQLEQSKLTLSYTVSNFSSENCCGTIHSIFFRINIRAFSEAKQFNSCLNKKISIDKTGAIRNCPSMKNIYGHISACSLQEALNISGFKSSWEITKDKINICKVCEFRYMCSDCRAYLEEPDTITSKPLKCGYDPYTKKWEEWSTNPLKQKAIKYYGIGETDEKRNKLTLQLSSQPSPSLE